MTLTRANGTILHAHEIARDLSDITMAEMIATWGSAAWWPMLRRIREFLAAGQADTMFENDIPVAMFGHMPHNQDEGARVTWFLAGQRYFQLGPRGIATTRRYLRGFQMENAGVKFVSYTLSRHPDADRWFRALGFEKIGDFRPTGGGIAYRLNPWARANAARDAAARP